MPFSANWIKTKIAEASREDRLAHAFILSGQTLDSLEGLLIEIAGILLGSPAENHPDFHLVQPQSKSRRITIEQIRELEHELYLKPHHAPRKVAALLAAERMCMGAAEAANAFLKTLEEPPEKTNIFLVTSHPEQLLPTIFSRCLSLPLHLETSDHPPPTTISEWIGIESKYPAEAAFLRARMLGDRLLEARGAIEKNLKSKTREQEDHTEETVLAAQTESLYLKKRDEFLEAIIRASWASGGASGDTRSASRMCEALEELRYALSRNVEASLSIERACLKISGLIP